MQFNVDMIYPIGSIYITTSSVNPGITFGGTWTQLKNRFLLGASDTYKAGSTGGEATHTLTVNEMPNHTHYVSFDHNESWDWYTGYTGSNGRNGINYNSYVWKTAGYKYNDIGEMSSTGGGKAHNNIPPYLAVYIWERTA